MLLLLRSSFWPEVLHRSSGRYPNYSSGPFVRSNKLQDFGPRSSSSKLQHHGMLSNERLFIIVDKPFSASCDHARVQSAPCWPKLVLVRGRDHLPQPKLLYAPTTGMYLLLYQNQVVLPSDPKKCRATTGSKRNLTGAEQAPLNGAISAL